MKDQNQMSFLDHLEELRWHLIRSVLSILIFGVIAFMFKDFIFNTLLFGPKSTDFITYKWFCDISQLLGQGNSFCVQEMPFRIQSRTMAGQFSAHLWTSILAGFIVAFPYVLYEVWKFISPWLNKFYIWMIWKKFFALDVAPSWKHKENIMDDNLWYRRITTSSSTKVNLFQAK